jgi:hypothetical protein
MSDKTFSCKDLDDNEVAIIYKTVLSAFDQEKINEVYMSSMVYNPETKKAEVDWSQSLVLAVKRQDAILQNVIKSWSRPEPVSPESIKKALASQTFNELVKELETIVSQGEVDDSKKKNSPEN